MNVIKKDICIAKCTLTSVRKWTKKMINDFYPQPSKIVPNPYYRCAAPMKLYNIEQVVSIEETDAFKTYWTRVANKRAKARAMMIERHRAAKAKLIEMKQHTIGMSNQRA